MHLYPEDQSGGRHARSSGDQHMLDAVDLVDRGTPQLAHALGDAVHAVDVGLAELPAVGVDRQPPADLDGAAGNEVLGLALTAETELLELDQRVRGEVVIEDGGLDVGRETARSAPRADGRPGPSPADRARRGSTSTW